MRRLCLIKVAQPAQQGRSINRDTVNEFFSPQVMKSFLHITKLAVLYLVQLLVIVLVIGRIYEVIAEARDDKRLPPPGQLFEVDGHLMHIHC